MSDFKERPITSVDDVGGFFVTGTVAGASTWTETHVSATTSGGGSSGHMYQGTVYISNSAPTTTVSSTVTEVNRFFLQRGDREEEVKLKGEGFSVRDGHVVSVIRIGPKNEKWGYDSAFYNHSTGKVHAPEAWLAWPLKKKPGTVLVFLAFLAMSVSILMALSSGNGAMAVVTTFAFCGIAYIRSKKGREYSFLIEAVRSRRQQELEAAKSAYAASKAHEPLREMVAS